MWYFCVKIGIIPPTDFEGVWNDFFFLVLHTFCGERDADRKRAWRDIASKKKKRSLAVGVPFSELLLRVFFVVSSERFLKGTFTLLKRCSRGLLGETRGKNARYSDTRTYLRRTQSVRW